jgi:ChrR-like protein with cupin domain
MDAAVTPKGPETAETHSHVVRPDSMEWQKTRFPGCEAKTLLFDRSTGLMTALMRFAPGAVLPDHEHVNIEQTYVLEGSLVDKEGPARGVQGRRIYLARTGQPPRRLVSARRADARDLPGSQQVLRSRRPRRRCLGPGLGRGLGAYQQEVGDVASAQKGKVSYAEGVIPPRRRKAGYPAHCGLRDLSLALWNTGSSAFAFADDDGTVRGMPPHRGRFVVPIRN